MAEVLDQYEVGIRSITLLPSDGGRFEVMVDGRLVYSKLETGRHMEQGEILELLTPIIKGWDEPSDLGFCELPQATSD